MLEATLFSKYTNAETFIDKAVQRKTERGELMKELVENLNVTRTGRFRPLTMSRMGQILEKIPTDALYTLASKCRQEADRNKKKYHETYSKVFWFEIRPKSI